VNARWSCPLNDLSSSHFQLPHHSLHSWSSFLLGSFRSEYEETKKKGGIAHRKEKSKWEAEQEKEEEVKVNSFQTISRWKQEPDHMKEVKQENEEPEKWHEDAEKVIEDQAMRGPSSPGSIILKEPSQVSPMHIHDLDSKVVEEVKEASKGTSRVTQYTKEEEADIQTIVHFFLSGGDDGESDESLIWAKLAEKVMVFIFSWVLYQVLNFLLRRDIEVQKNGRRFSVNMTKK